MLCSSFTRPVSIQPRRQQLRLPPLLQQAARHISRYSQVNGTISSESQPRTFNRWHGTPAVLLNQQRSVRTAIPHVEFEKRGVVMLTTMAVIGASWGNVLFFTDSLNYAFESGLRFGINSFPRAMPHQDQKQYDVGTCTTRGIGGPASRTQPLAHPPRCHFQHNRKPH